MDNIKCFFDETGELFVPVLGCEPIPCFWLLFPNEFSDLRGEYLVSDVNLTPYIFSNTQQDSIYNTNQKILDFKGAFGCLKAFELNKIKLTSQKIALNPPIYNDVAYIRGFAHSNEVEQHSYLLDFFSKDMDINDINIIIKNKQFKRLSQYGVSYLTFNYRYHDFYRGLITFCLSEDLLSNKLKQCVNMKFEEMNKLKSWYWGIQSHLHVDG